MVKVVEVTGLVVKVNVVKVTNLVALVSVVKKTGFGRCGQYGES